MSETGWCPDGICTERPKIRPRWSLPQGRSLCQLKEASAFLIQIAELLIAAKHGAVWLRILDREAGKPW